jgi:hypothetical protein
MEQAMGLASVVGCQAVTATANNFFSPSYRSPFIGVQIKS